MYIPELPLDLLKEYIIEHAREVGLLAIDLVLLGISSHAYRKVKNNIQFIEQCREGGENPVYKYGQIETNRTYGIVSGTAKPIGTPLYSLYDKSIQGVVHKLTITEHVMSRNNTGFWGNYKRILDENIQTSPFYLVNSKFKIAVQDPGLADKLDLNITYDKYENTSANAMDLMLGILSGSRQRGIQTTEEMLRTGCAVTIIGEIIIDKDNSYSIVPPGKKPFYIISGSVQTLLNSFESKKQFFKAFAYMFGCIACAILYYRIRDLYKLYNEKRKKYEQDLIFKQTRKQRRAATRDKYIIEELRCVVCQTNGREIVLMPCGHFCLCEDCNDNVKTYCPMCRSTIVERIPSYL